MPEATEQEFRLMLSGLTGVSPDTICLYLSDAKAVVIGHGVGISHAKFSQLQRYQAAHLMSQSGVGGNSGPVTSESVADVSISYGDNTGGALGTLYATNWERNFQKCLTQIQGLACRCL